MTIRFSKDHEWIKQDGQTGTVGITDYAQHQLGDVVYVELPNVGSKIVQGSNAAVVESVKAASEVYAPVDGIVTSVNEDLSANPATVNSDPEAAGWFFKIQISNAAQLADLMDETAYKAYIEGLH